MTVHKNLKSIIRERQRKTGESYTAARVHVMRAHNEILGIEESTLAHPQPDRIEALVLSVGVLSARVRLGGEANDVTLRTSAALALGPAELGSNPTLLGVLACISLWRRPLMSNLDRLVPSIRKTPRSQPNATCEV